MKKYRKKSSLALAMSFVSVMALSGVMISSYAGEEITAGQLDSYTFSGSKDGITLSGTDNTWQPPMIDLSATNKIDDTGKG